MSALNILLRDCTYFFFFFSVRPQHKGNSLISNQTVVEGRNAEFYCRLEAFPTGITYKWFKEGNLISNSGDYSIDAISNGWRLTIKQAKKNSAGQYSCEGTNDLGTGERKSAYLLVNCKLCF